MKSLITLSLFASLAFVLPAFAAEKKEGGPNGGRLITMVEPHLELLVTKDRKVEISAVEKGKVVPLGAQVISITAGDRSKPTKLEFKTTDGKLVSTNALPAGEDYPVSVSIKTTSTSKAVYDKFNLDLNKCPTCKFQEYACICGHSDEKK